MIYDSIVSSHGWTVMLECYEAEWVHRAYTVGLSERGLPEFAIGELPYEDNRYAEMEFGQDAMIHVLEQVASRWESARVSTGTPIEVEAYEGWNILVDPSPDTASAPDTKLRRGRTAVETGSAATAEADRCQQRIGCRTSSQHH